MLLTSRQASFEKQKIKNTKNQKKKIQKFPEATTLNTDKQKLAIKIEDVDKKKYQMHVVLSLQLFLISKSSDVENKILVHSKYIATPKYITTPKLDKLTAENSKEKLNMLIQLIKLILIIN